MERRRVARGSTYLGGQVAFNHRCSTVDCLIRNKSEMGAKLALSGAVALPDEFDLTITRQVETLRARVVWRREDEMGVAFCGPEPVAAAVPLDLARRLRDCEAERMALQRRMRELNTPE